jgi:hydroxypyruvate isomerase
MPRFAANLGWLFTEHDFLDRFAAAARAGFRAVEFAAPYAYPPDEIAMRLLDNGLECILINLPMGDRAKGDVGIACRPDRGAEFREGVARGIVYAQALGVPRMNVIAGLSLESDDRAALRATLVENLAYAAQELGKAGLDLLIEPLNDIDTPGFFVTRQSEGVELIGEVGAPNFGLQCDLYHVAMMGEDPTTAFERHRKAIRHMQFADAPGRGEPGRGRIDYAPIFESLDRQGYAGWLAAEYRPSRPTPETLSWFLT